MDRRLFVLVGAALAVALLYAPACETLPLVPDEGGLEGGTAFDSGDANLGPIQPNCNGLAAKCAGESCCAASNVPGGTFNRLNNSAFPATVSAFRLDTYEVVVGRFRAF